MEQNSAIFDHLIMLCAGRGKTLRMVNQPHCVVHVNNGNVARKSQETEI